ncbi:MAG: histidine kinase [Bacteroidia bacterium]|nr:histidine kinase [Bacteroidia bacterium]
MSLEGITVTYILLAGALVFTVVILVILLLIINGKRQLMVQRMAEQEQETEQQRELLAALVMVQENERQKIAKDLHDGVGATLSLVKLQFAQVANHVPEQARAEFAKPSNNLSDAIWKVRQISHDLLPPTLDHLGLGSALERLFIQVQEGKNIRISFNSSRVPYRIPQKHEMLIYRIVNELTNQSIQHANATLIKCILNYELEGLVIIFSDNGKGLDQQSLEQLKHEAGLGWKNIQSRLQVMNGSISFLENDNSGLALRIFVPQTPKSIKNAP